MSNTFIISVRSQKIILEIARQTIEEYLNSGLIIDIDDNKLPYELKTLNGAFVSLHKKGEIRGCVGSFNADRPLHRIVQNMAISAAFDDCRFAKLTPEELNLVDIEISVLSPLKKIDSVNEIVLGKHGIYLVNGTKKGTFLPQVAERTGWKLEEFLGHCARDKAGIGWDGWKNSEIFIYEAFIFGERINIQ